MLAGCFDSIWKFGRVTGRAIELMGSSRLRLNGGHGCVVGCRSGISPNEVVEAEKVGLLNRFRRLRMIYLPSSTPIIR